MSKDIKNVYPQILAFSTISSDGMLKIKKRILKYLNLKNEKSLFLSLNDEILLSTSTGSEQSILENHTIQLSTSVLSKLEIQDKATICFIQRPKAVALKKFDVIIGESIFPQITDIETTQTVLRRVETFVEPELIYNKLIEQISRYKLKFNPKSYWKDKETFSAWKALHLMGVEINSQELQSKLIQDRLMTQEANGSWGDLITTAKNLLELSELGMSSNYPQIQKAIKWLMDRPESNYNPGMFFLKDELIDEQKEIIRKRKEQSSGSRERFRKRLRTEMKLISSSNYLHFNPCGPRIMWPNALVLESLLAIGYEYHERVNSIFETLLLSNWCECAYQHGLSAMKRKKPFTMNDIEKFEQQTDFEYRHGGLKNLQLLMELPKNHLGRITEDKTEKTTEYKLKMPIQIQGCELISTQALGHAKGDTIRRYAEAHLKRFVVRFFNALNYPNGLTELMNNGLSPFIILSTFAKYNSVIAKLGIILAIPWLIENQNEDGTWGDKVLSKESATLTVLEALRRINFPLLLETPLLSLLK
ncbi:MAG TPA: hypothetical protein VMZ29_07430 [Candidatus Bathyarchaeia archaeon]|nr:hypothetical protein [Candidatus Bathyarchaeia archaeon]